jgi:hypothetical protein
MGVNFIKMGFKISAKARLPNFGNRQTQLWIQRIIMTLEYILG